MHQRSAVGIDFGTTNSVAAVMRSTERAPVALTVKGLPHPSVVWYQLDRVVVGADAKSQLNAYEGEAGHRLVRSIKAMLGQGRHVDVLGESRPAYEVAAEIFRHVKEDAADRDDPVFIEEAVVTVPVKFDGRARADIRRAAGIAGIHVTTFVHEPFAAVIGYYESRRVDPSAMPDETVLVFDWGGGTLDVTLARAAEGKIDELATGGLSNIAGDHFDALIEDAALEAFLVRHGFERDSFTLAPSVKDRLATRSELAKIRLSTELGSAVDVAGLTRRNGETFDLFEEMTREQFETLISRDLERAMAEVDGVLRRAHVVAEEIDRVLLIGGSSEIPALRNAMARRFGTRVVPVPNSQTIIAEGAAAVAYRRYRPYLSNPIHVLTADGASLPIFDASTVLPEAARREVTLVCTDNRDGEARIALAEQQRAWDPRGLETREILRVPVEPALPKPYNHERIYARFHVDDDLILHVEAHGAAKRELREITLHDLRYGLQIR